MTRSIRSRRLVGSAALLTLALGLGRPFPVHGQTVTDPVRSFLAGFNPTDQDFFAHPPARTVLLRMTLDADGDGRLDLAVSESTVFGTGGGPWLLFRRLPSAGYRYLGEIFAAPGNLRPESGGLGRELAAGSALSAETIQVVRYRVFADSVVPTGERDTRTMAESSGGTYARLENCRQEEYRRSPVRCWHSGWLPE